MAEGPNESAIKTAVKEGFMVLDEGSRTATINFDPNEPKLEIKRALDLKAALEHRGYKVHAAGLEDMGFKFDNAH
jgi:hypothetical protein